MENNQDNFDSVERSSLSPEGIYDDIEDSLENCESNSVLDVPGSDSSDHIFFGHIQFTRWTNKLLS